MREWLAMIDTPTREQVQQAIEDIAAAQYDGKEPRGVDVTIVCEAADEWLEGPQVDEAMIIRGVDAYEEGGDPWDVVEAILRAALEVGDDHWHTNYNTGERCNCGLMPCFVDPVSEPMVGGADPDNGS
jgi:hypothetical protein